MSAEDIVEVSNFYAKKTNEVIEIEKLLGDVPRSIITNILRNPRLFRAYKRSDCKKYANILNALDNLTDNDILIFISELQLYGIFLPNDYLNFTKQIVEMNEDKEMKSNPFQVVLNNKKQKLVFLCTNHVAGNEAAATIDRIAQLTRDHFGTTVNIIENDNGIEITVNKIINGDERNDQIEKLIEYISKHDKNIANKISLIQTFRDREYKYTTPKLKKDISTLEELITILKTSPNITIYGNINIANNGGVNINGNNNAVQTFADKKLSATNWIGNNLPDNHDITTEYYSKYELSTNFPIHNNQFGKLVKNFGYKTVKGNNYRYWSK